MTVTIFTDEVEIEAPTQVGLVVTGPVTGVGAGTQLTTTGTGGRGWEILATGQSAAQGQDKLNIRDLGSGQDALTIDKNGNIGIGNIAPGFRLQIEASNDAGLAVFAPDTSNGAGATLMNRTPGGGITPATFQGWEILATGQAAAQGSDKLNIARQSGTAVTTSSRDVLTITSDGKVGIGTTSPGFKLEIDAPDQLGLHVAGPNAGAVGAGISLTAADPLTAPGSSWEILATGHGAAQGPGRLNIRNLKTSEDIFTIVTASAKDKSDAIGIGTTAPAPGLKLEVNGDVQVDGNFTVISPGVKSAAVPFPDGSHRRLYCVESPESWFEDFGFAELCDGEAQVPLDPGFSAIVEGGGYHVFITQYEDNNALYVTQRTRDGFVVRAKAQNATGMFSYRVVARRRDVRAPRFEKVQLGSERTISSVASPRPHEGELVNVA